ncbi:MAG: diguanylate cyclase domain-containing protein [Gammaproteobacteria bacterium]
MCCSCVFNSELWALESLLGLLFVQMIPIAVHLFFSGEPVQQLFAIGAAVFVPCMSLVAIRNNILLMRGAITELERRELVSELEEERKAVVALNRELEQDIERRRLVESDLREAKTRAESLAERLEKLSALDGLTGIANRRRFDQTLQREWSRALRSQKPLALVLGDIDYFKEYNDRYGHQAGDAALRQLAQLLERSARRGGDLAARYGGEEFTLLMPETTLSQAVKMADLVRESLQQLGVPHDASKAAHVLTASFGVTAMVPTEESSPTQLVKAADEALYAAKAQGRNIVQTSDGSSNGSGVLDSHSSIDR